MNKKDTNYEILRKTGIEIFKQEYENLQLNHPFIGEKLILDLVNGVGVVAKDLNSSAKGKEKGFARVWDEIKGYDKKRQNQMNENFIEGLNTTANWLQDHDRHLSSIDLLIKDVSDDLLKSKEKIKLKFKDTDFSIEILENFRNSAEKRFENIESRLAKIEAQQHIDRELSRLGRLNLPLEAEVFTILDNLVSGEFGIWYLLSEDIKKKNEQLEYLKNKLKKEIGNDKIKKFIDFYTLHQKIKKLNNIEQKALGFISSQYREFNNDTLYDSVDIIKLTTTIEDDEEFKKAIDESSHIRSFITLENYIDDTVEYIANYLDYYNANTKIMSSKNIINIDTALSKKQVKQINSKETIINSKPNNRQSKLGVVLSGGGAKGAYEVGFLKALAELNIQPDAIAGTSIGALNGAIYCANKDTKKSAEILEELWEELAKEKVIKVDVKKLTKNVVEVYTFFAPLPISKISKIVGAMAKAAKSSEGTCEQEPIIDRLKQYAPEDSLLCGLPFYVAMTPSSGNLGDVISAMGLNGKVAEYKKIQKLKKEDMHKAIMASAALPILFDSVKVEEVAYRDGFIGYTDNEWGNTPAKPLIEDEKCTHLIVCHLNKGSFFNRNDPLFKNIPIIEVRPEKGTFSSALDPLRFKVENIDKWIEQGYKDSIRILTEAFKALEGIQVRKATNALAQESVDRLKNQDFKLL